MKRFIYILSYIIIILCIVNSIATIVLHFKSHSAVTPFPYRVILSIVVGSGIYLLLLKKFKVIAILGLLFYLILITYNTFQLNPILGLKFTGTIENVIRNFFMNRIISSTLGYLGTWSIFLVIVWNLIFDNLFSETSN